VSDEPDIKAEIIEAVPVPKCGLCGCTGIRLYRPHGMFRREADDRCNQCTTGQDRSYYVPLILDSDGAAWGYSSARPEDIELFSALPEKTAHPGSYTWHRASSTWELTPGGAAEPVTVFVYVGPYTREGAKVPATSHIEGI